MFRPHMPDVGLLALPLPHPVSFDECVGMGREEVQHGNIVRRQEP